MPLHFAWGEALQFDWSEEGIVIGGVYRRVQMAHLTLCASRAFWLAAYPGQSHEMLFDAHTRSLAALGGVARRGIYDNMRTAVDKVSKGNERIVNARFAALCAHYLIDAHLLRVKKVRICIAIRGPEKQVLMQAKINKLLGAGAGGSGGVSTTTIYPITEGD